MELLEKLAQNLSIIKYRLKCTDSETEKYQRTLELAELTNRYKDILSPEYMDSAITVLAIRLYLDTGQAETIEQAVALYNKDTPYSF